MKKAAAFIQVLLIALSACSGQIFKSGKNIAERFPVPENYVRVKADEKSFAQFLRTYPLKAYGSPVLLYNGEKKWSNVHESVFDMPILTTDL
ncbi:MAG: DUF4846 domain-containing protein, partial [Treponema sp.]|nr:DUF4846 domain-containing protein [Treponema sp.]